MTVSLPLPSDNSVTNEISALMSLPSPTEAAYEIGGDQCISILCLDWREVCDGNKTPPFDFFAVSVREEIMSDRSFYLEQGAIYLVK